MMRRASGRQITLALIPALALSLAALFTWLNAETTTTPPPVLPAAQTEDGGRHALGPVRPPRTLPNSNLLLDDDDRAELGSLLKGRWTLMQLMFTGCSTTCPIQGAIFAKAQAAMRTAGIESQFLSLSVDPLGDDAAALLRWLDRFGAQADWRAAAPPLDELGPLLDVLGGRGKGVDVHDARVYLIGPNGKLVYITEEMPSPASLVAIMAEAQTAVATTN